MNQRMPDAVELTQDASRLTTVEVFGGWRIVMTWELDAPVNGPTQLLIHIDSSGESIDSVSDTEGLGEIIRTMPLRSMRERLAAAYPIAMNITGRASFDQTSRRITEEREYAALARQFVSLTAAGNRQPIAYLQHATGTSRNTINGRLRRARELDLLVVDERTSTPRLTDKAIRLLSGKSRGVKGHG